MQEPTLKSPAEFLGCIDDARDRERNRDCIQPRAAGRPGRPAAGLLARRDGKRTGQRFVPIRLRGSLIAIWKSSEEAVTARPRIAAGRKFSCILVPVI